MQVFRAQDIQRHAAALQDAATRKPVIITYHERPRFVLMSMQEYDRLRGRLGRKAIEVELPDSVAAAIEALGDEDESLKRRRRRA